MKKGKGFASFCASMLIGYASWGHGTLALSLAPLVVLVWMHQSSRVNAFACMLLYYLTASRGLPSGVLQYFDSQTNAAAAASLWLGAALVCSLPWALLWKRDGAGFWWRFALIQTVLVLPPVGLVGWTNPMLAAANYFPAWGWFGLLAMALVLVCAKRWPVWSVFLLSFCLLLGELLAGRAPQEPPSDIVAHQTMFGGAGHQGRDFMKDYAANEEIIQQLSQPAPITKVDIFPESVAGYWTAFSKDRWSDVATALRGQGRTVLVGVEVPLKGSQQSLNGLLVLGAEQGFIGQRVPVPVSMWVPFSGRGTKSDVFGDGIHVVAGHRIGVFICYEQLLPWTLVITQLRNPQILVGVANSYWAKSTSIPDIQQTSLIAWAKLFGLPVLMATNF